MADDPKTTPPPWLKDQSEGLYYGPDDQLVVYPLVDRPGVAILDRTFTARQLRDVFANVHRSPVISGAGAVFSTRGGDFVLTVGGDLAVGYRLHDRDLVHLFCAETIAAQTVAPEAVCVLEAIVT